MHQPACVPPCPGTPACNNGSFYCANRGYEPKRIRSAFVDDGFCGMDVGTTVQPCTTSPQIAVTAPTSAPAAKTPASSRASPPSRHCASSCRANDKACRPERSTSPAPPPSSTGGSRSEMRCYRTLSDDARRSTNCKVRDSCCITPQLPQLPQPSWTRPKPTRMSSPRPSARRTRLQRLQRQRARPQRDHPLRSSSQKRTMRNKKSQWPTMPLERRHLQRHLPRHLPRKQRARRTLARRLRPSGSGAPTMCPPLLWTMPPMTTRDRQQKQQKQQRHTRHRAPRPVRVLVSCRHARYVHPSAQVAGHVGPHQALDRAHDVKLLSRS